MKSAQEFFIVGLIQYIQKTLQMWFYESHVEAEKYVTHFMPPLQKKMCMKYKKIKWVEDKSGSPNIYQIGDILEHHFVDLDEKICICRKFDLGKFSCSDAITVVKFKEDDDYNLCNYFIQIFVGSKHILYLHILCQIRSNGEFLCIWCLEKYFHHWHKERVGEC